MARLDSLFPDDIRPKDAPRAQAKNAKHAAAPAQKDRTPVAELAPGQEIEGIYRVGDCSLRAAKNGSKYIQGSLGDKSGLVAVRHWDATESDYGAYKASGYVRIRGRVETYQNRPQIIAFQAVAVPASEVQAADFLPVSTRDPKDMEVELDALVASIRDADYRRLLEAILNDPVVREKYLRGPAATALHHAWLHGLLEHVLSAAQTAVIVAQQRPFLNRDLLVAGVILHDIGKIEELSAEPGFPYTDTGQFCGHIVLGALLVERFVIQLKDFPPLKRDLIQHMILSHHGTREFGSPVTPCTAEAVALHHIECMDAKVQGIQSIVEKEQNAGNTGAWSDYSRMIDGRIYKGSAEE